MMVFWVCGKENYYSHLDNVKGTVFREHPFALAYD